MCRLNFQLCGKEMARGDAHAESTLVDGGPPDTRLGVHERISMKNAFNDERLDRWRGVLHATIYHGVKRRIIDE